MRKDDQALLEMRKIPGVLGHVRRADSPAPGTGFQKIHDQKCTYSISRTALIILKTKD